MAYAHKFRRQGALRNVHRAYMEEPPLSDARHEEEMRRGERREHMKPGRMRKRRVEAFYGKPRHESEASRYRREYRPRGPGAGRYPGHDVIEQATGYRPYDYEKHRRHKLGGRRRKSKKVRRKKTKRRQTRHKRRRRSRRTRRRRR